MDMTPPSHRHGYVAPVRLALALGIAALGVLMAACGSSSSGATATTSGGSSKGATSTTAFQSCLAKHGVTLPSGFNGGGPPSGATGGTPPSGAGGAPPSGAGGVGGNSKFQKAIQACASLQPKGARGTNGANSTAFASYKNCMKLHGVTIGAFGPGTSSTTQTTVDTTSAAYQAAATACKSLLPSGGAPPASGAAG